jgi:hypothetical protein
LRAEAESLLAMLESRVRAVALVAGRRVASLLLGEALADCRRATDLAVEMAEAAAESARAAQAAAAAALTGVSQARDDAIASVHAAAAEAARAVEQALREVDAAGGRARETVEAAAERIEQSVVLAHQAAHAAEGAAQEASRYAMEAASPAEPAPRPAPDGGFGGEAHALIERLEADYELLSSLVRELHAAVAAPPARQPQPESVVPQASPTPDSAPDEPAFADDGAGSRVWPSLRRAI